jgi:hypothetical protein
MEKSFLEKQILKGKEEVSEPDLENQGFETVVGYDLEIFSSKEEMYIRMEQIRKENSNEAVGFIEEKDNKIGFYYKVGENKTSVEFDQNADTSWHSHTDISNTGHMFSDNVDEDLPDDFPEDIKKLREEFFMVGNEIDTPSSRKASITDLITFLSGKRNKDLISMPGGLLEISSLESVQVGLLKEYANRLDEYGKNLFAEGTEISLISLHRMQIRYLYYAITEFKSLLTMLGYEKITEENSLEILEKMGFKFEFHKV